MSGPDFLNARIDGLPVKEVIKDQKWLEEEFPEKVQKRGGVLIQKWGRSSAASTTVSIVDAIRSLITPTPKGDWFSTGEDLLVQHHLLHLLLSQSVEVLMQPIEILLYPLLRMVVDLSLVTLVQQ